MSALAQKKKKKHKKPKNIKGAQGKPQTSLYKEELWAKKSKIPLG